MNDGMDFSIELIEPPYEMVLFHVHHFAYYVQEHVHNKRHIYHNLSLYQLHYAINVILNTIIIYNKKNNMYLVLFSIVFGFCVYFIYLLFFGTNKETAKDNNCHP